MGEEIVEWELAEKNYFSKLIFAVSCNSFKLSLGTLEKEFETWVNDCTEAE